MRTPLIVALAASGVLVVGAGSAYATRDYLSQPKVIGKGETRLRSAHPNLRLFVEHPDRLTSVVVEVDGRDVSRQAVIDGRGIIVKGVGVKDGWHKVRFAASRSGLFGPDVDRAYPFVVDTHKPRLALQAIPGSGFRAQIQLVGKAEKNSTVRIDWKGGHLLTVARGGAFVLRPLLPDGAAALRVSAIDGVGNRTVAWRKVTVDSTPPSLQAARIGIAGTNDPVLKGSVQDGSPVTVQALLDGGAARLDLPASGGPWTLPLHDLYEGEHEVMISVTDAAGNTSQLTRRFTVDSIEKLKPGYSLGPGARGKDVRQLQRRLRSEHLWKGPYANFYNARTVAAVRAYQAGHDLVADGIASPAVIEATAAKILVDVSKHRLWLIRDGKRVFTAPIATGAPGYDTPTGNYTIISMAKWPTWTPPNSPWAAGLEPIPPGPGNPLGSRWIGTSASAVGFHATPQRWSIGHSASHGCMRMYQEDVEKLYDLVKVGMTIQIIP